MQRRLGKSNNTKLTEQDVRKRLASYPADSKVTDELYDFGKSMVSEAVDRMKTLDSKAAAIAAYSIGLITVLVSSRSGWQRDVGHLWAAGLPICAGVAAFGSAAFAVWALALKNFYGFTQNEWLKDDCLNDAERLRRFHILTMWKVFGSHTEICEVKASKIAIAQYLLLASAMLLVIALAEVVFGLAVNFVIKFW